MANMQPSPSATASYSATQTSITENQDKVKNIQKRYVTKSQFTAKDNLY